MWQKIINLILKFLPEKKPIEIKPVKVALVIGHSESSQGAVNITHGITEYGFNTYLVDMIYRRLGYYSFPKRFDVHIKRFERVGNYGGVIADVKKFKSDIMVSFHCNAFNTGAYGTEVLIKVEDGDPKKKKGSVLFDARDIAFEISELLETVSRGVKRVKKGKKGRGILARTGAKRSFLLEPFFIDNDIDFAKGYNKKDELAEVIFAWIKDMVLNFK